MSAFKKFIVLELIFSIILGVVAFVLFQTLFKQFYLPVFWFLFGLIATLTAVFHYSVLQVGKKDTSKFSSKFMMFTGIKMMAYLIVIVFFAFTFPEKAKSFLISFLVLYLLYTVFEVILILDFFKKKKA